ncbi:MAG: hypothetical protein IIW54_16335, partial [Lachnospiraceae bacterium]|nr:hypothetical protein [Lachnospiraceae bacterium]
MGVKQMIQSIDCINHAYTNYKWRERRVSFGNENSDKVIYVARRANSKAGLFSLIITSIGQIQYAVENGYSPVVDLGNYGAGISNIWDYYFEQPSGISLDEMRRSSHVILGNGIISQHLKYPGDKIAYSEQELSYWKKVSREHLMVREGILKEAEQLQKKLFSKEKVLGVLARGTDYINTRPYNHPVQPTM